MFSLKSIIDKHMPICKENLEYFKQLCLIPSQFTFLSLLPKRMEDTDKHGVIEYLNTSKYNIISDDEGHLLNQMYSEHLHNCMNELSKHIAEGKIK
jgi:hypothetical protein